MLGWPPRASYLAHALLCGVPALCLVSAALLSLNMGCGLLCRRQLAADCRESRTFFVMGAC